MMPLVDLIAAHKELEEELVSVFRTAVRTAGFIGGPMVEGFEQAFARFCGTEYCVGVGSGTDALRFILMAVGARFGEIVVTVPNTFIATTEAISQAGAQPDFVDIDERTYNLDPAKLQQYLETQCEFDPRTKKLIHRKTQRRVSAIIPVHLYGQMADLDPILELAERYNLVVVEDACQAHGAEYFSTRAQAWKKAGSLGRAAAFSFYPSKNLGACGEAGAVTTNDGEIARTVRMLRDHGQAQRYYHDMEGYNGRLDAIQAGILRTKLRYLPKWNEKRRENAERYNQLLVHAADRLGIPYEPSWSRAVYHLYVIRTRNRDQLKEHLEQVNIGTGIHYPLPLHLQEAYAFLGFKKGNFPVAERVAAQVLSLPMYPTLAFDEQRRIANQVIAFAAAEVWSCS